MTKRRQPWTPEEDDLLTNLKIEGLGTYEIAAKMQRSGASIDNRWHLIRSKTDPVLKPRAYRRRDDSAN